MKLRLVIIFTLFVGISLFVFSTDSNALSPELRFEMLKVKLVEQLKAEEYSAVLTTMDEIKALGVPLPKSFTYFEGKALYESGNKSAAYTTLEKYVEGEGKGSKYFSKAIAYLVKAEDAYKAEKQREVERQIAAKKAILAGGFIDPTTGMVFVLVKGGCFQMGSPATEEGRDSDEGPVHEVCVDDFFMGQDEVTNAQYRQYKSSHDSGVVASSGHTLNSAQQPVVKVSWDEVQDFIKWLNRKTGQQYRLPTEAEWEYAARGGTATAYSWGNSVGNNNAVCRACGSRWDNNSTAPVGSFTANSFGLYDMSGNVMELCQDWYGDSYYRNSPSSNPQGPETGSFRVHRGGCWHFYPSYVRSANRGRTSPGKRADSIGFRLVYLSSAGR